MSASTTGTATTNYFALAEEMTLPILAAVGGQSATYSRAAADDGTASTTGATALPAPAALTVVPAGEGAPAADEYGLPSTPEAQDFLCAAADLAGYWPPAPGDKLATPAGDFAVLGYEIASRQSAAMVLLHCSRRNA